MLTQHSLALKLVVVWLVVAWAVQERAEAAEEAFLVVFAKRRMNSGQSAYNLNSGLLLTGQ